MRGKKIWLALFILGIVGVFVCFLYWRLLLLSFLTFSDAAKSADTARQILLGKGANSTFAFFTPYFVYGEIKYFSAGFTPIFPLAIAALFKIFGPSDLIVILTSGLFYLAGAITLFYLGKKVFGNLVGFFASLAFIFDPAILNYATSGASESLFIFEIILATLLIYMNKKVSLFLSFLVFLLMYFTRPSAIIYIFGFVLLFILLRFKKKVQLLRAIGIVALLWLLVEIVLIRFSGRFFLYSPISSLVYGAAKFSPLTASTTTLRGGLISAGLELKPFLSKFFYNLYNFYKLLPNILSPYLAGIYILSLFRWDREREKRIFRLVVLLIVAATFVASAAFLPIYRYLHPVIPFIYLLAVEMLVWIVSKVISVQRLAFSKRLPIISRQSLVIVISFFLLFIFIIGQTTGKIFLDSRFVRAHTNQGKSPVYAKLAWLLKENTNPDDLVITNLDTWGSWYGERKTIWFPLDPKQLIPPEGKELKIDAIYLTSYKIDDENYYMGEEWREIFYQSEELEDPFFAENFELAGKFEIMPEETYEREGAVAILLVRK